MLRAAGAPQLRHGEATFCRTGGPPAPASQATFCRSCTFAYPGSGVLTKPMRSSPALAATLMTCATLS
jgi:hypothetical protein